MAYPKRIRFTYEDFQALPSWELTGKRYELIDGDLIVVPSPTVEHQYSMTRFTVILGQHVRQQGLGVVLTSPIDVHLGEEVVEPDVVFVSNERKAILAGKEIAGAPDLVIEVFSPSTGVRDRTVKRRLYEAFGVIEYWLADGDARTVEVLRNGPDGFQVAGFYRYPEPMRSALFPDLEVDLQEVFGLR